MKAKFIYVGGPFDGKVGKAYTGVTDFWKKTPEGEYHYSRVSNREFKFDRQRMKKTSEKAEKRDSAR